MITDAYNKQHRLGLKISLAMLTCFTLIASSAISMPTADIDKSHDNSEGLGFSGLLGCSVNISKPMRGTAYFFDEFEIPLLGLQLPIIIGGITCRAEVNVSNGEEPAFLQWKFANWQGDFYWSHPISYESGVTKYYYYNGVLNFGQFKIWIYCFDKNNEVICENTIGCLKIF